MNPYFPPSVYCLPKAHKSICGHHHRSFLFLANLCRLHFSSPLIRLESSSQLSRHTQHIIRQRHTQRSRFSLQSQSHHHHHDHNAIVGMLAVEYRKKVATAPATTTTVEVEQGGIARWTSQKAKSAATKVALPLEVTQLGVIVICLCLCRVCLLLSGQRPLRTDSGQAAAATTRRSFQAHF